MHWFLTFLRRVRAWGLPYHGVARGDTLTTDIGSATVVLPASVFTGEVVEVQSPAHQPVEQADYFSTAETASHTARHVEWREYAFLSGRNRLLGGHELYPIADQMDEKQWIYCDASTSWIVGLKVEDRDVGGQNYVFGLYLHCPLLLTAGKDPVAPTPRLLATYTLTFKDSLNANSDPSNIAVPDLCMTHSRDGAKTAVNVFLANVNQENLDLVVAHPLVTHNSSTPYAEIAFRNVFNCIGALKVEITGTGSRTAAVLGQGITATVTKHETVYDMVTSKTGHQSWDYPYWQSYEKAEGSDDEYVGDYTSGDPGPGFTYTVSGDSSEYTYTLYWYPYTQWDPRTTEGTYYGGWRVNPDGGGSYSEVAATLYLYVSPDGDYSEAVSFSGWSGYQQDITVYPDGGQTIIYDVVLNTLIGGYDWAPTGTIDLSKTITYVAGSSASLSVWGQSFGNTNTAETVITESLEYVGLAENRPMPVLDCGVTYTDTNSVVTTATNSGDVPAEYVDPMSENPQKPLRIVWKLAIHTPTIIDVFYQATDQYNDGGTWKTQPQVYVASVAANGTKFSRYVSGSFRRASFNPRTGDIVLANSSTEHVAYV